MIENGSQCHTTQSHSWCLDSGVVAHRWKGTVEKPPAILILQHGFGEYATRYFDGTVGFVQRLQNLGWEIWALDVWGHGDSPGKLRGVIDVHKAINDLMELHKKAVETHPNTPTYFFGHSMGGLLTACSVMKIDFQPAGVILCAAALQKPAPWLRRFLVQPIAAFWGPKQMSWTRKPIECISRIDSVVDEAKADPKLFPGAISWRLAATALQAAETLWSSLHQWTVPTLVLHGTADQYTDPEQSRKFFQLISSPDKDLHLLEGGYHELYHDSCAAEFNGIVVDWLAGHLPKA
ncbi:Alpha/Beta hydrolase protein [Aspergillus sergii]|uniref:Alpha/Beta hydrolase protein n=1 Tax=Aspergillus sergii TaxID=1034303 RepID=A0A5N6X5H9_9EURO|nr:Alpha/Beta hydrolase protein [Aspergillus sergii]